MFYSAVTVKLYISAFVSGLSISSFRSFKLANYSLFENPKLLPKYYLLPEIQTFSFSRIMRY